ncbi:MAG: hypothetical protein ACJA08_000547 [Cyclobacteriaceae bacterium]|jgi:hypothetical protein
MTKKGTILLTLMCLAAIFTSCKEDYNPKLNDQLGTLGFGLHSPGYTSPWPTFHLGDSMQFVFSYTGTKRLKAIDVSIRRIDLRIQNDQLGEILLFESFYPATRNFLDTIRWKLDSSFGITPSGYIEEVRFNNQQIFSFYISE